eukprot:scaffold215496_cov19-Tisochrysis_lutea.AAC.1
MTQILETSGKPVPPPSCPVSLPGIILLSSLTHRVGQRKSRISLPCLGISACHSWQQAYESVCFQCYHGSQRTTCCPSLRRSIAGMAVLRPKSFPTCPSPIAGSLH